VTSRIPRGSRKLLYYDCAEEVGADLALFVVGFFKCVCDPLDVSPQGLPLVLLIPNIWALKRRYLIADRPIEQLAWVSALVSKVAPVGDQCGLVLIPAKR
jgi:hypothetical protein